MSWVVISACAALMLAMHQLSFKWVSTHYTAVWGGLLYMIVIIALFLPFAVKEWVGGYRPPMGLIPLLSILALGVTGALFVWLYPLAFQVSPSTAMVLVIVDAGAVLTSIVLATLIWGEVITLMRGLGIMMAILGIVVALKG